MIIPIVVVVEFLNATSSSVGYFIISQDSWMHERAVFRIVVERVDILIAINFYHYSNFTVQMALPGDSRPCR